MCIFHSFYYFSSLLDEEAEVAIQCYRLLDDNLSVELQCGGTSQNHYTSHVSSAVLRCVTKPQLSRSSLFSQLCCVMVRSILKSIKTVFA